MFFFTHLRTCPITYFFAATSEPATRTNLFLHKSWCYGVSKQRQIGYMVLLSHTQLQDNTVCTVQNQLGPHTRVRQQGLFEYCIVVV